MFVLDFRDYMEFKNVAGKIATYWLLRNKSRTKWPSLQVPPRVPIFTTHSPPSTPGFMATTPMSPNDFTRQLSSKLNQLQHQSFPTPSIMKYDNPSIVVDSPGHHDEHENVSRSNVVPNTRSFGWGCCIPSISNRVAQDPVEAVTHKFSSASNSSQESDGRKDSFDFGRKDSFECVRKDSHDSGILVNPARNLQRVPEDEPVKHRRPGICVSHQSSNVSEICQQFEKIVDEHKTKQDRLNRKSSEGSQQSPIRKSSSISM